MIPPPVDTDMPAAVSLAWSMFLGAAMSGWAIYELYRRNKESEQQMKDLEQEIQESSALQRLQQEVLEELDRRIREKQDYDETDEVDEKKYQAWKGTYESEGVILSIVLYREKQSTIAKNQEWISWSGEWDGSCVVRGFYLGNSSPDFQWKLLQSEEWQRGLVEETMINGWDSVVKLEIAITVDSETHLQGLYSGATSASDQYNGVLRVLLPKISWSRILLDA